MQGTFAPTSRCTSFQSCADTRCVSVSNSLRLVSRRAARPALRQTCPSATLSTGASVGRTGVHSVTEDMVLPAGHVRYETMVVLRPDMIDEERDSELAKFEAFLSKLGGSNVNAMVRGRQRLAYPIKKFWEGIYVLYDYSAPRSASQQVQKYLSTPIVGKELNILRHMTFNR